MTTAVEKRLLSLEERLATMERLLEERLPVPATEGKNKRGWQAIVGTFAADPFYDEAMKRGQEWHEAQTNEVSTTS